MNAGLNCSSALSHTMYEPWFFLKQCTQLAVNKLLKDLRIVTAPQTNTSTPKHVHKTIFQFKNSNHLPFVIFYKTNTNYGSKENYYHTTSQNVHPHWQFSCNNRNKILCLHHFELIKSWARGQGGGCTPESWYIGRVDMRRQASSHVTQVYKHKTKYV